MAGLVGIKVEALVWISSGQVGGVRGRFRVELWQRDNCFIMLMDLSVVLRIEKKKREDRFYIL